MQAIDPNAIELVLGRVFVMGRQWVIKSVQWLESRKWMDDPMEIELVLVRDILMASW